VKFGVLMVATFRRVLGWLLDSEFPRAFNILPLSPIFLRQMGCSFHYAINRLQGS